MVNYIFVISAYIINLIGLTGFKCDHFIDVTWVVFSVEEVVSLCLCVLFGGLIIVWIKGVNVKVSVEEQSN